MDDSNLTALREHRDLLLKQARSLLQELQHSVNKTQGRTINIQDLLPNDDEGATDYEQCAAVGKDASRLCDVSQSILGVQFQDVTKKWISGDIYFYKAEVVTKIIIFGIDLTVDVKANGFRIQDINCHFSNIDECYLDELAPWVHRFARAKQFSHLMSGISGYSERSVVRARTMRVLEAEGYITIGNSVRPGGGFLIYVHDPAVKDKVLFEFHWSVSFVDRSWRVEHIFAIDAIDVDEKFVKDNEELLRGFCAVGLSKNDLENLWSRLCDAIGDVTNSK